MIASKEADVVILGGGPAGLAAACACAQAGAKCLVVERENRLGGILKQCIHDGFGLIRYKEKLTGPEYALRDTDAFAASDVPSMMETYVSRIERGRDGFLLYCVNREGVTGIKARALVLATGCRERTDRQVFIHGDRPAGIYTAGLAQYMVNIQGLLPGRRAVLLGTGDIGLIMARRLSLEGVEVRGAYEIRNEPSGLSRNVRQCLEDFSIPLELSTTVCAVHGNLRVEGVTVVRVDEELKPVAGSEREMECDMLVLSVGLIPENELATSLGVPLDPSTRGPMVDQNMHTLVDGVFACGNAVHVNDLVDYVSESGEAAGRAAACFALRNNIIRNLVPVRRGKGFLAAVPQFLDIASPTGAVMYFRSSTTIPGGARVAVTGGPGKILFSRGYPVLRPPEMERFALPTEHIGSGGICLSLEKERL